MLITFFRKCSYHLSKARFEEFLVKFQLYWLIFRRHIQPSYFHHYWRSLSDRTYRRIIGQSLTVRSTIRKAGQQSIFFPSHLSAAEQLQKPSSMLIEWELWLTNRAIDNLFSWKYQAAASWRSTGNPTVTCHGSTGGHQSWSGVFLQQMAQDSPVRPTEQFF